jgi:tetratricopeptide (TPR) repeat protein
LRQAIDAFDRTLAIDSENATAHYNLERTYRQLGDTSRAEYHGELHLRYKRDDSIAGEVVGRARKLYPAADQAAEALVIYSLHRDTPPNPSD